MRLKFLQVNIFRGKFLGSLLDFIEKVDPDIITMQEVSCGEINLYEDKKADLFELIKGKTGYDGVFHSDTSLSGSPFSRFGNGVFSKWPINSSAVVPLATYGSLTLDEFNNNKGDVWARLSRHMLDAEIEIEGKAVHAISIHGRRIAPPLDDPENIRQAHVMANHLKSFGDKPFIVGGDFNMPPGTEVIKIVSSVASNLMADCGVKQTLNPQEHELGEKGYLVDFIFTSKHFKKISLEVPQVTVSDHLPVVAELEML
ncbi:MAG: endonuclease/exonuclease/phosphatase family protein [Candidatus Curtissbacteria bacterium]|nr:endonuclease/exonuclease/phosphatase family protein [Candidatus Curtissbacteria bacterium]